MKQLLDNLGAICDYECPVNEFPTTTGKGMTVLSSGACSWYFSLLNLTVGSLDS